jgi:phosphohistidine phosphatase
MAGRRLVLIRHSKAQPNGPSDAERELSPRGLRDATAIGEWLAGQGIDPDHVVISPARRTQQTWAQIAGVLPDAPAPLTDHRIYDNQTEALIAIVTDGDAGARRWLRSEFPTSAVAIFEVAAEWPAVGAATGRLVAATAPRGNEM